MIDENIFAKYINEQLSLPLPLAENIVSYFDYIVLPKNTIILQAGTVCDKYMFIHHGISRSFIIDKSGNEITTNFFTKCQVAFEPASFFNRSLSPESIQTVTECAGWVVDFQKMNTQFHTSPEHREFGRRLLVKGIVDIKERMILLQTESAENRYLLLLKQYPELLQNVPLKQIASYLGITDTSLSRVRKQTIKK